MRNLRLNIFNFTFDIYFLFINFKFSFLHRDLVLFPDCLRKSLKFSFSCNPDNSMYRRIRRHESLLSLKCLPCFSKSSSFESIKFRTGSISTSLNTFLQSDLEKLLRSLKVCWDPLVFNIRKTGIKRVKYSC